MVGKDIIGIIGYAVVIIGLIIALIWGMANVDVKAFAEGDCDLPDNVCEFAAKLGFPRGWLSTEKFIWYSILPLLGIWLIIYGFLDRIKIFKGAISALLAFVMAFSTIPLGFFVILVATLFSIMGTYAVFMFVALFVIGLIFFFRARLRGWKAGSIEKELYDADIQQIGDERKAWEEEREQLKKQLEELPEKVRKAEMTAAIAERARSELLVRFKTANENVKSRDEEIKILKKTAKQSQKTAKKVEKAEK